MERVVLQRQQPVTVSIDWKDVALHVAVGAAVGCVAAIWSFYGYPYVALTTVILNAIFWHGREWIQRIRKGQPYSRVWTGTQCLLEWVGPSVTCAAAWLALEAIT